MLITIDNFTGYKIDAKDGEIGHIKDVYFDEERLTARYLIVDTGPWIFGRKVLISPQSAQKWEDGKLQVNLTKEQIKEAPSIDAEKPISREKEEEYNNYYALPVYWSGAGLWGTAMYPGTMTHMGYTAPGPVLGRTLPEYESVKAETEMDTHLRSCEEVKGYNINTTDGEIGHIDDFIMEQESWNLRYFTVDTGGFLSSGKKVVISNLWIQSISWNQKMVVVDLPTKKIEEAPEIESYEDIDRAYEEQLVDHYGGRGKYWE
jgi:uncharacterized protein YrrD